MCQFLCPTDYVSVQQTDPRWGVVEFLCVQHEYIPKQPKTMEEKSNPDIHTPRDNRTWRISISRPAGLTNPMIHRKNDRALDHKEVQVRHYFLRPSIKVWLYLNTENK